VVPVVQSLYEALLTMQPTSVEAEKATSACGLVATKDISVTRMTNFYNYPSNPSPEI